MNGRSGDHPLTDIVVHRMQVFSPEVDELIVRIHTISPGELDRLGIDWFAPPAIERLEALLNTRFKELLNDAKDRGWEAERF